MDDVVVVGGGLAGLAISGMLSKAGFSVRVLEAREKPTQQAVDEPRSINLAISARGLQTLEALGLASDAMRNAIPLYGRRIHLEDLAEDFQSYDLVGTQAIYSVRRSHLWRLLCAAAEANGVDIRFNSRCLEVDSLRRTISIAGDRPGITQVSYNALIGSDGTHSMVRRTLAESGALVQEFHSLAHGYVEFCIPSGIARQLDGNALHIWPREDYLLVALPNVDGTFTATLFFPWDEDQSNGMLQRREKLSAVFRQKFPDAVPLIPNLSVALAQNPICRLFTGRCRPWTPAESVLLIGDAAHTMAPFYGQGMNCALEDCFVLMRSVERFRGNWAQIFSDFECRRHEDAEAIMALSEANYHEMSHKVVESEFKRRREIERVLQERFPAAFIPLYAMIAFTTLPYSQAVARSAAQAALVDRLVKGLDRIEDVDLTELLTT
jgi:kynurenine 3-monooxygenase